jgi:hypothetical protein
VAGPQSPGSTAEATLALQLVGVSFVHVQFHGPLHVTALAALPAPQRTHPIGALERYCPSAVPQTHGILAVLSALQFTVVPLVHVQFHGPLHDTALAVLLGPQRTHPLGALGSV